jgi:hypothetical protein
VTVVLVEYDTAEFVLHSKESDELGNVILGIESRVWWNVNGEQQRRLLIECDSICHGSSTLSTTTENVGALQWCSNVRMISE